MGQSHQAVFVNQSATGIAAPHPIPPPFGQEGIEATLNPAVQPREEVPYVRFAIERPPAPNHGIDPLDHLPQFAGSLPPGEVPDLVLEPFDALLTRHGLQALRIGSARAFRCREPQAFPLLDLVAQELEALADMHDPRLVGVQGHAQFLAQKPLRNR
jgi:hypothetical protein